MLRTCAGMSSGPSDLCVNIHALNVVAQVVGATTLRFNPQFLSGNHCAGTYGAP